MLETEKCYFDVNGKCSALKSKECEGCKFRKTKEEFEAAQQAALEALERKGLIVSIGRTRVKVRKK